jgi:hypothetical protein
LVLHLRASGYRWLQLQNIEEQPMTRILAAVAVLGILGAGTAFADSTTDPASNAATSPNPNAVTIGTNSAAQDTTPNSPPNMPSAVNDAPKPAGQIDSSPGSATESSAANPSADTMAPNSAATVGRTDMSPDSKTAAAPLPGANSFTQAEALSRLEAHGYTAVSELQKDDQSIWRGKAMKDGKPVDVALDYRGNIVAE